MMNSLTNEQLDNISIDIDTFIADIIDKHELDNALNVIALVTARLIMFAEAAGCEKETSIILSKAIETIQNLPEIRKQKPHLHVVH